jgi:hypothetical protein
VFLKIVKGLFNIALAYGGWVLSLHEVIHGRPYSAVLAVVPFILIHFATTQEKLPDLKLLLTMALLGTVLDSLYIALGLIHYNGGYSPYIAPLWVTALWALLSISINHSLSWLQDNLWMASLFGAIGAPISYLAAIKLGAGTLTAPPWLVLTAIGLAWSLLFPALFKLSAAFHPYGCDSDE